jgi:hypothetical protein
MRKVLFAMGIILLESLVAFQATYAASVRTMGLNELIDHSDYIVYGRAARKRCLWDTATRTIWTQTEFQVLDKIKGEARGTVIVTEPGGVIGEVGHLFPGVPIFDTGGEWVLFLHSAPGKRMRATGLTQGVYAVFVDPVSQERVVRLPSAGLDAVSSSSIPVFGPAKAATQTLNVFLKEIGQKVSLR